MATTIEHPRTQTLTDERDRLLLEREELGRATAEACPGDLADLADEHIRLHDATRRLAAVERRLAEVDAALDRVTTGAYGRCEVCHRRIAAARLEVVPATTTCTKHASVRRSGA